jgi:hypothetical protein
MNRVLYAAIVLVGISALAGAQQPAASQAAGAPPQGTAQAAGTQAGAPTQIAAGTVIPAELSKSVDAKKSKSGDKVEAKTTMDLLSHGQIVIPRNTKIVGHVTDAKAHSKESPDSKIEIAFDRILMKDGRELPFQAAIQAIGKPEQLVSGGGNEPMSENPGAMPAPGGPSTGGRGGMETPGRTSSPQTANPPYGAGDTSRSDQGTGRSAAGPLSPGSAGVVGMPGLSLSTSAQGSTISSEKENVHLDGGTQLILRVTGT